MDICNNEVNKWAKGEIKRARETPHQETHG